MASVSLCRIVGSGIVDACKDICADAKPPCASFSGDVVVESDTDGTAAKGSLANGIFMPVVILLIILLFFMNVCIGLKRYLSQARTGMGRTMRSENSSDSAISIRNHVVFVNPTGSFHIGKQLKKEVEGKSDSDMPIPVPMESISLDAQQTV